MSEATFRLRNMRTRPGQSLHDLMCEVADEADATLAALKRLSAVALDYFPAEGEAYDAMEQTIDALAKAGDADSLKANRESEPSAPPMGEEGKR